jgi:quinol monooxygenase YgiN
MDIARREFLARAAAVAVVGPRALDPTRHTPNHTASMYGLIGRMMAVPGRRDALVAILLEGVGGMPGCLSYVVATDPADADAIWITEVWESQASHQASLALPAVRDAIARGRPLIAGFGPSTVTLPVGGHGL